MSEITNYYASEFGDGNVVDIIEEHRATHWKHFDSRLKMFAYSYLSEYNHLSAASVAGIDRKDALKTIRNPLVQAFVQDVIEDRQISTSITQDFVSTMWMKVLPKLLGEEEVAMVTASGEEKVACKFFASESVAALREMGKSTKFYEDGSGGTTLNLTLAITEDMSPGEASDHYMRMVKGERV